MDRTSDPARPSAGGDGSAMGPSSKDDGQLGRHFHRRPKQLAAGLDRRFAAPWGRDSKERAHRAWRPGCVRWSRRRKRRRSAPQAERRTVGPTKEMSARSVSPQSGETQATAKRSASGAANCWADEGHVGPLRGDATRRHASPTREPHPLIFSDGDDDAGRPAAKVPVASRRPLPIIAFLPDAQSRTSAPKETET